jgi:hypothetical protein
VPKTLLIFLYYSGNPKYVIPNATFEVIRCESCHTPMPTYYTSDWLILYVCPNWFDWSASETVREPGLFFVN